jgi:WD40 repeat protein
VSTGESKAITPEGIFGVTLSPDGKNTVVREADGGWGVWPLDGNGIRPIAGLDSSYYVTGWSPDGTSIYVASRKARSTTAKIYKVNTISGKMELWRTFGSASAGVENVGAPHFSADGNAYAYVYERVLSEAFVVTGLK